MDRNQQDYSGITNKRGKIQLSFNMPSGRVRVVTGDEYSNTNKLQYWAQRLNGPDGINELIKHGRYTEERYGNEFPRAKNLGKISPTADAAGKRTLEGVWQDFKAHCEVKLATNKMAFSTLDDYRKRYEHNWKDAFGARVFRDIQLSELRKQADKIRQRPMTSKNFNNIVSALKCIFEYGWMDKPLANPANALYCEEITKKEKPKANPLTIGQAESLIAAIGEEWGEISKLYDEFRFFTGMRPCEQIALDVSDLDQKLWRLDVTKARVMSRDKGWTKTGDDRFIELCPRAIAVAKRQLIVRAELKLQGKIDHDKLFFHDSGAAWHGLQVPNKRWKATAARIGLKSKVKGRKQSFIPYNARHSCVSWNLMLGKNPLQVARQHGHSVEVMNQSYADIVKDLGSSDKDAVAAIQAAFNAAPCALRKAA